MVGEVVSVSADRDLGLKDLIKRRENLNAVYYMPDTHYFSLGKCVGRRNR